MLGEGTPKEQAKAYVELLDELGIDKVYVLGTSAGGTLAIRFALDYPKRTKGLILYSSTAPSVTKPESVPRPAGPPSFMMNNYCMWLFKPFISQVMGMDSSTVDMVLPINEREEGAILDLYGNNIDIQKHFDDYPIESLKVPTLIFQAKDDKLANYENVKAAVSRFPNCTFVAFETGGHLLVGNEESLNRHLKKFLMRYRVVELEEG